MAKPTIYLPDDLLRDARAARVNVSGACREGLAARTYGPAVLVPEDWYAMALAAVGGDGPGTEPPPVWPLNGHKTGAEQPSRHQDSALHDLGDDQLSERVGRVEDRQDRAEKQLRAVKTYVAVGTGIAVVALIVLAIGMSDR